jgi:predicted DCC family thiol-disulfide oxidoreductase YuxK
VGSASFLYDGDCAFCSACARFIERRVATPAQVIAWQWTDLGALGVTREQCDEAVQWIAFDGAGVRTASEGPAAIADLMRTSTRGWRAAAWLLGSRVGLMVAWPVYRWVSRHRDRMPGGTPTCALPAPQRSADSATLRNIDHRA